MNQKVKNMKSERVRETQATVYVYGLKNPAWRFSQSNKTFPRAL